MKPGKIFFMAIFFLIFYVYPFEITSDPNKREHVLPNIGKKCVQNLSSIIIFPFRMGLKSLKPKTDQ